MITIGVTGGVGSGKSEILHYLQEHYNVRVLLSDDAAKELEKPGGALYEPILALLREYEAGREGHALLEADGSISKKEMAARIFSSEELLQKVNEVVHPTVNQYILDEIAAERAAGRYEFYVLESALLIENDYDKILDSMWYIYCNEKERERRLIASREYSSEKIRSIMDSQMSEAVFRAHCDVVIDNSGELEEALRQVDDAIRKLRRQHPE